MAQSDVRNTFGSFVAFIALGWGTWFFFSGDLQDKAANDAIEQYNIAKQKGTAMDACVQAGNVRAAFFRAKDDPNYQKWRITERMDCRIAGMPDAIRKE